MRTRQRFEAKYDPGPPDACWPWKAAPDQDGYGMFWHNGRTMHATRVQWELTHGEPPPSHLLVLHSCDNPPCVNPSHLSLGTVRDNALEASARGRLATGDRNGSRLYPERLRRGYQAGPCRNGHDEKHRYVSISGESRCTLCQRYRARRARAKAGR